MSSRYALNTAALVLGGFLLVATQAFSGGALTWLGFAVSAAVVLIALAGLVSAERVRQYASFATLGVVATWTVIASLVFAGTLAQWLIFGAAAAYAVITLAALAVHEVTTERVVHTLELRGEIAEELRATV